MAIREFRKGEKKKKKKKGRGEGEIIKFRWGKVSKTEKWKTVGKLLVIRRSRQNRAFENFRYPLKFQQGEREKKTT